MRINQMTFSIGLLYLTILIFFVIRWTFILTKAIPKMFNKKERLKVSRNLDVKQAAFVMFLGLFISIIWAFQGKIIWGLLMVVSLMGGFIWSFIEYKRNNNSK